MHLPPLHELCVAAAPTGTPVPDTEDLLAVWAAHTQCNICMGFLALNPSAVDGEDGTPWRGPPGSKAWVVVCATGRGHAYHKQCIQERRRAFPDATCPECQQPIVDYGEDVPLPPLEGASGEPARPELPQEVWDAADALWEQFDEFDAETGELDREASAEKRRKFFNSRPADVDMQVFRAFNWRVMEEGFGEAVMEVDDEEDGVGEPPDNARHLPTMEFDDAPRNFVHPAARAALLEFYDATIGENPKLVELANQFVATYGLDRIYEFTDMLAHEAYKVEYAEFYPGQDYKYGIHYDEDGTKKWADRQSRWERQLYVRIIERMQDTNEYRAALAVRETFMSDPLVAYDAVSYIPSDDYLCLWAAKGGLAGLARNMANSLSITPPFPRERYADHVYYLLWFAKMNEEAPSDYLSDDEEPAEPSVERQRSRDRPLPTLWQARLQRREAWITEQNTAQQLGVTPAFFDSIYTWWKRWSGIGNEERRRLGWVERPTFSPAILWADVVRRARLALPDANPDIPAKDRALQYVAELFSEGLWRPQNRWVTVERTLHDLNYEWGLQRAVETFQSGEAGPSGVNS